MTRSNRNGNICCSLYFYHWLKLCLFFDFAFFPSEIEVFFYVVVATVRIMNLDSVGAVTLDRAFQQSISSCYAKTVPSLQLVQIVLKT